VKKILFQSDCSTAKTGFGRNAKAILSYLYKTGKYDLHHYCVCQRENDSNLKRSPWKSYGTFPSDQRLPSFLDGLTQQEAEAKKTLLGYGEALLDETIEKVKPDVYFAVQDIWGIDFAIDRKWFKSIDSVLWTTLDSLPILDSAVKAAKKTKNFWVWSEFAEKELHKMGHTHVRTVHGAIDESKFFRKSSEEKEFLRKNHGLNSDDFIVGFVFRNQLRKSVFALLKGFHLFKLTHPQAKAKLLLHTGWEESWNIQKFMQEYQLTSKDVLTTYICKECQYFKVDNATEKVKKCPKCERNSFGTTSPSLGISEEELNDVYNLMDVYCHPFTSGGQEMPIQEAKLTELITLVTNYSCGEDNCAPDANSLPLAWEEYREPGTQFIKAATSSASIAQRIEEVYLMDKSQRREKEIAAREWTLKNYSIPCVCGKIEKFIDTECNKKFDYIEINYKKNPTAAVPNIQDDKDWIKTLYKNILNTDVEDNDDGLNHWLARLKNGEKRQAVEGYFRSVAQKDVVKKAPISCLELLKKITDKKLVLVIKNGEREAFYTNCLTPQLRKTYNDYKIIIAVKKELMHIFDANENVDYIIEYHSKMSTPLFLEGKGFDTKYCDIAIHINDIFPNFSYIRNNEDKINHNLICI
jgi:glycosyltransferase involved in cell wall biosynthesis